MTLREHIQNLVQRVRQPRRRKRLSPSKPRPSVEVGRYRFKGEDKSLRYRKGQAYQLATRIDRGKIFVRDTMGKGLPCPYTLKGFTENWESAK